MTDTMLRVFKWILLVPVLLMLGFIAAEKADMTRTAFKLVGINPTAAGAVCNPDWEAINPLGCRFRYNLATSEFATLQAQQLTPGQGWKKVASPTECFFPTLHEIRQSDSVIYLNNEIANRVRWVVYNPQEELLYLGFFAH